MSHKCAVWDFSLDKKKKKKTTHKKPVIALPFEPPPRIRDGCGETVSAPRLPPALPICAWPLLTEVHQGLLLPSHSCIKRQELLIEPGTHWMINTFFSKSLEYETRKPKTVRGEWQNYRITHRGGLADDTVFGGWEVEAKWVNKIDLFSKV